MSAKPEKTETPGVYRRGGRYVVAWRKKARQHWTSFVTYEEACDFKSVVAPPRTRKPVPPAVEVDRGYSSSCRVWQKVGVWGYGLDERGESAHRIAYERAHGAIPDAFHVHHLCGQPDCVNPDHLTALSPAEHARLHHKL